MSTIKTNSNKPNFNMELSKEIYTASPQNQSIVQSAVESLMKDENIVGKSRTKNDAVQSNDKPPEKKKRGRPPKKVQTTTDDTTIIKKPRGRPRKNKDITESQKESKKESPQKESKQNSPQNSPQNSKQILETESQYINHDSAIIPLIQSIQQTHDIQNIPNHTLKYVIFLIHLFHHTTPTPTPHNTLHSLLHHTLTHFKPHSLTHTTPHIKHYILHFS